MWTRAGWMSAKKTCPMKPIWATATIKMENTLAGRYHIQICEAKRINRTALGWQCFVNRICTAVIDCSRWQHIQHNAYSQHDLAFCSGRTEWGFIMCNCRPLRRVSTPVSFGLFSLPLPPPFFLVGIPNVALIWASGFWITLPFTDRDLNFQLFSCALARSTTPHSPSLSLSTYFCTRENAVTLLNRVWASSPRSQSQHCKTMLRCNTEICLALMIFSCPSIRYPSLVVALPSITNRLAYSLTFAAYGLAHKSTSQKAQRAQLRRLKLIWCTWFIQGVKGYSWHEMIF